MFNTQVWQKYILPIFICSLASMFYLYDFVLRVTPSVMLNQIMAQFQITPAGYGFISSCFLLGYMLLQVPCGLLNDKYGPKRLLTINCLVAALAAYLFLATNSAVIAAIARLLMGMGSAFAYIGALLLSLRWLPKKYYAMSAGVIQLLGSIGAIIGQAPLAYLLMHSTPSELMTNIALCGLLLAILFWLFIQDYPQDKAAKLPSQPKFGLYQNLIGVIKTPQNWAIALYSAAIWAPISIFASLWCVPFMQARSHLDATTAASLSSCIWIGIAIGGPILGWLSNHINRRKLPLLFAASIGLIASLFILHDTTLSPGLLMLCLVLYGVAGSAQAVTFGVIDDNNPSSHAATAAGFNNMSLVLGGVFLQPLVGMLLRYSSPENAVSGIAQQYPLAAYQQALIIIPMCFALALLAGFFIIRETKCQPYSEPTS